MKIRYLILISLLSGQILFAQGLFESALSEPDESIKNTHTQVEINGFVRGALFSGKQTESNDLESKAGYGELGLKFKASKGSWGDAFAEIRFLEGSEYGEPVSKVNIREAYASIYTRRMDFYIGEQIIVWGKADGFNPTNNMTPQNMLVKSADEDDHRESNFLFRGFYTFSPFRLEMIWIPQYTASALPYRLFPFPEGVVLNEMTLPENNFKESNGAIKLHWEFPAVDGSVSWYQGYMPFPGIKAGDIQISNNGLLIEVIPTPYRMNVFGADFSTTLGSFGLRGELAYRLPEEDEALFHIPNADLQTILGIDRAWGDFSLILQYIGRYVHDFEALQPSEDPAYLLEDKNRMIAGQSDEFSHSVSARPALNLRHETITIELLGMYNTTTEEIFLRPKMTCDIADALTLTIGAEIYDGPEGTLYGTVNDALSAVYIEVKGSF